MRWPMPTPQRADRVTLGDPAEPHRSHGARDRAAEEGPSLAVIPFVCIRPTEDARFGGPSRPCRSTRARTAPLTGRSEQATVHGEQGERLALPPSVQATLLRTPQNVVEVELRGASAYVQEHGARVEHGTKWSDHNLGCGEQGRG